MKLQELVCCSTCPIAVSSGPGSIALHDIETGTLLASFKQTSADQQCTAIIESRDGLGGLVIAAQHEKALLHTYSFQKDQLHIKMVLPEKLTCLVACPSGLYCAGGTSGGRIYIWEIASGLLLNAFEAHYRKINTIRFTRDSTAVVSGSDDSGVSVWLTSRLLDITLQDELVVPYCTLSDHTLPVNDISCGFGPFPNARILTGSSDSTCKLWDLSTKSLIATFIFPQPITNVVLDPSERAFFASSSDGSLHQVNLFRKPPDKPGHRSNVPESLTVGDAVHVDSPENSEGKGPIKTGQTITSLCLSMTGSLLLAGSSSGLIQIYDVFSHQLVRTIHGHQGFSVNSLTTLLKPPDLAGHINFRHSSHADPVPILPIAAFQRVRDASSRKLHEVPMMLPPVEAPSQVLAGTALWMQVVSEGHQHFTSQEGAGGGSHAALNTRITQLEAELQDMRQNLAKAKGLNDAMWDSVVKTVLASDKQGSVTATGGSSGELQAKRRGRVNVN